MFSGVLVLGAVAAFVSAAPPAVKRDVDTTYPYTGPEVPIGDLVDHSVQGNGTGYRRLREPPAVRPHGTVTNNINVISSAFWPGGINIHFQTPFGIGEEPRIIYGASKDKLNKVAKGTTHTYDRTPPCSFAEVTQCSQFFHEVPIVNLKPGQTYFYQIPGGNGTEPSEILSFKTAPQAGSPGEFSVGVVCDMGYTNARDTHLRLLEGVADGLSFVWHGGDISYADQWFAGIIPCVTEGPKAWDLCYNGSYTTLPGGEIDNDDYYIPVPAGEIPSQGGPNGGDVSTMYEPNWDLWAQFMNPITKHIPYMVAPGNHEAACAEFDGPENQVSAILDDNLAPGSHKNKSTLSYYSCPESQRNFTAYQHRFHMPGNAELKRAGGQDNFWYSFDHGLAHFVTISTETDFYKSPSWPFVAEMKGNPGHPTRNQTFLTDAGPFGAINGSYTDNANYEQIQWLRNDLAKVDRKKTPWIFVLSHRPMYSTEVSSYQANVRNAFEQIFLDFHVDVYLSGHIHWYERMLPLGQNGSIVSSSVVDDNTYKSSKGSLVHIVNGQAGQVESHSTHKGDKANYTAVLDQKNWGLGRINVKNQTHTLWEFVKAKDGELGDYLWIVKDTK